MQDLFDLFIREKNYLEGVAPRTLDYYKTCWSAFNRYKGEVSELGLKNWVINMREAGVSPGAVNCFARGINSFLSWLHVNTKTETRLKVTQLKTEKRVLKTYTEADVTKIVKFNPKKRWERRIHTMICFMIDTGCRIDEVLTLRRDKVDLENLLVTVYGKGRKERIIPISREVRAILYSYLRTHNFELVFCSKDGLSLTYDNMRRDFVKLLDKLGIEKSEGAFHAFRRFFSKNYVKYGGNLFYLMKQLGHTTMQMSKQYVEADTEELQHVHAKTGILARLR